MRSDATKSFDDSLRVNEIVAVWPTVKAVWLLETTIVGLTVSTERVRVLLLSAPSAFWFPDTSENLPLATIITPLVVLLRVGVKVAVYVVPEPLKSDMSPSGNN